MNTLVAKITLIIVTLLVLVGCGHSPKLDNQSSSQQNSIESIDCSETSHIGSSSPLALVTVQGCPVK